MPAERTVIEAFLDQEIALRVDPGVAEFLNVLDDFIKPLPGPNGRTDEVGARQFRRWLRGKDTQFGQSAQDFCHALAQGAIRWCSTKAQLYKDCHLLLQTRLAVFDFYWLMKLFGAEVSTSGIVTYKYPAWFDDLCCYAASPAETKALVEAREIFFQAGSLACNWMQKTPLEPATPVRNCPLVWNQVFCEELREIAHYRWERPENPEEAGPAGPGPGDTPGAQSFSSLLSGLKDPGQSCRAGVVRRWYS